MLHKEAKHIDSTQFSGLLNLQLVVYWFIISENIQAHKEVGSVTRRTVYPRFNHSQHLSPPPLFLLSPLSSVSRNHRYSGKVPQHPKTSPRNRHTIITPEEIYANNVVEYEVCSQTSNVLKMSFLLNCDRYTKVCTFNAYNSESLRYVYTWV